MKKFLSKLPVMIILIVLSLTTLVGGIYLACRPVAYNEKYTTSYVTNCISNGLEYMGRINVSFTFSKDNTLMLDYRIENGHFVCRDYFYIKDGDISIIINDDAIMTKEEKSEITRVYMSMNEGEKGLFLNSHCYMKTNAYSVRLYNTAFIVDEMTNDEEVRFSLQSKEFPLWLFTSSFARNLVISISVELILLIFTITSIVCFAKNRHTVKF